MKFGASYIRDFTLSRADTCKYAVKLRDKHSLQGYLSTETEILPFWRKFYHWLHRKLTFWQLSRCCWWNFVSIVTFPLGTTSLPAPMLFRCPQGYIYDLTILTPRIRLSSCGGRGHSCCWDCFSATRNRAHRRPLLGRRSELQYRTLSSCVFGSTPFVTMVEVLSGRPLVGRARRTLIEGSSISTRWHVVDIIVVNLPKRCQCPGLWYSRYRQVMGAASSSTSLFTSGQHQSVWVHSNTDLWHNLSRANPVRHPWLNMIYIAPRRYYAEKISRNKYQGTSGLGTLLRRHPCMWAGVDVFRPGTHFTNMF